MKEKRKKLRKTIKIFKDTKAKYQQKIKEKIELVVKEKTEMSIKKKKKL